MDASCRARERTIARSAGSCRLAMPTARSGGAHRPVPSGLAEEYLVPALPYWKTVAIHQASSALLVRLIVLGIRRRARRSPPGQPSAVDPTRTPALPVRRQSKRKERTTRSDRAGLRHYQTLSHQRLLSKRKNIMAEVTRVLLGVLAGVCLSTQQALLAQQTPESHVVPLKHSSIATMEKRVEAVRGDRTKPGEPFVIRIHAEAGYIVMPHTHPIDENIVVVKGSWALGMGDRFKRELLEPMEVGDYDWLQKEWRILSYQSQTRFFRYTESDRSSRDGSCPSTNLRTAGSYSRLGPKIQDEWRRRLRRIVLS